MDKTTNQIIAKWLGLIYCDHVEKSWSGPRVCEKCGEWWSEWRSPPDYVGSLDLVHEAELKAVEVFGELAVAVGLEKVMNEIEITKGACTHDEVVFRTHFAPAHVRASAVRRLLEER